MPAMTYSHGMLYNGKKIFQTDKGGLLTGAVPLSLPLCKTLPRCLKGEALSCLMMGQQLALEDSDLQADLVVPL